MMNEPIMRRGLSPEGRRIRQKHQGSLLNDEFGVTSQPIHKKIEKDFLKENVLRLKEIQAKCRTQESRPISGNQPVKAIRPTNNEFAYTDTTYEGIFSDNKEKLKPYEDIISDNKGKNTIREGSAHSDYFSLPDEAQNDPDQHTRQSGNQSRLSTNSPFENFSAKAPSVVSVGKFNTDKKDSIKNNDIQNCVNIITLRNCNVLDQTDTNIVLKNKNSPPKFRESYPHSPSVRRTKISNMIEKIKSKQPACETNTEFIWRDIRKEHRTLFLHDDYLSVGTPRTPHLISLKNMAPSVSKDSGYPNKKSSIIRSHSLDRNAQNRPKSVMSHDFNSTYTLEPRPKSSSTAKLVNVGRDFEDVTSLVSQEPYKYEYTNAMCQTESLPNLSDGSKEIACNSKVKMDNNFIPNSSTAAFLHDSTHTINDVPNFKNKNIIENELSSTQNNMPSTSTINCDSTYTLKDVPSFKNEDCMVKNGLSCFENKFPSSSAASICESTYTIKNIPNLKNETVTTNNNNQVSSSAFIDDSTYLLKNMPSLKNKDTSTNDELRNLKINETNEVPIANKKVSSLPNLGAIEKNGRTNEPILTKKTHLNQLSQQSNSQKQGVNSLLRSKSSTNLHLAGEPPPTYKRGHLPRYLKTRKVEAQRRLEAAAAIDPLCPPGHSPVPDHERRNTLHLLKKAQTDVMRQLSSLPVAQDTLRVRKLKNDLETKLSQIEDGIGIFSQPKVYVLNDEE